MEIELFEVLEEKINEAMNRLQVLTQQNTELKQKIAEKEKVIQTAQERANALEEEKEIIQGKVDNILKKISQALG